MVNGCRSVSRSHLQRGCFHDAHQCKRDDLARKVGIALTPSPTRSRPMGAAPTAGTRAIRWWRQKITFSRRTRRGKRGRCPLLARVGSGRCDSPKISSRSTTPHAETAMLRDDNGNGGGRPSTPRNVLGERLEVCSISPMTGFFRDGCCDTGREDIGSHTVCAVMTAAFLEFSKSRGNDLSTPMPEFGFRGLKPGDRWCLCAPRWQEALEAGQAPRVVLRATHEGALGHCSLADLKRLAVDLA